MAAASDAEQYSGSTFWTAPARNFRTSARLHLQHLLFQNTLGHYLDPKVDGALPSKQGIKVADIACGNGVWLCDLDRQLSAAGISAQLDGFDINPVNLPAAHLLPESVTLKTLDVLARPLPEELVGAYDVVHVRAFTSIIINEDLGPLLSTAQALLKPGGWLQWEESRADQFQADAPNAETAKTACDTIIAIINAGGKARGGTFSFLGDLGRHLTEFGFQDVEARHVPKRKPDLKAWTEDYLMVWEELAVFFPSQAKVPEAPMTKEKYVALFEQAVKETESGVVVHHGEVVVVVGRKAA
ncbi:S-adenosyl-L-methionine-dependent methyltransferase [Thozetella sp. PMI_491]|nr:S-adenosyl-L-methionine-dependent methyltransferase [Thozetella sp. PMI_491]